MQIKKLNIKSYYVYSFIFNTFKGGYHDGYSCREVFAQIFNKKCDKFTIMFSENIINILEEIQDKLKLKDSERIKYFTYKNTDKFLVLGNLTKFWSQHAIRRRFLLSVIKAVYKYKYKNLKSLKSDWYFKHNTALERFLKGYTVIKTNYSGGWDYAFGKKGVNILEKP